MHNKESHKESDSNNNNITEDAYIFRLFITGATPNSIRAVSNIKQICEQYLKGNYSLEIIDVYQQAEIAEQEQLVALPLLIKKAPLPQRRLIGDLSDSDKVLKSLGIIQ